ncbi:NADH-quinone oxidoreductase subunit G [Nocardioides zeae]|uniref:NADH-quinone oxidoreductase n=1 Tax=Nocardioides imazamoxiresistens TaxID=3231893 RepID=A0ABU3Q014_9ACTN|nr:NADH-quinone oxidoreductase subunit G [Nocardioides zeae]MDT9594845.1 NADH-quinone oxidoreductase subunit G [Nocardioides zeae]
MTLAPDRSDLVAVTIDGVRVEVPKGTLVIRAAEQVGISIPRFCDHPLLEPVGACRQCLVDVPDVGNGRGLPKPQASCTLEVSDGMVVNTQATSGVADKAQQGVMELLLINHPLDCPVCDKGGECPLQNQAMSNGRGDSRFEGVKRTFEKPIHLSPQVLLDRERCIVCQRCTRFAEQIPGDPFIALVERGARQQIGIAEDAPFLSYFAGNTIQICPVGALTSESYRFRSRPFDLVSVPSVAEHDACGAAIRVDHRRGVVTRRLAGDDPEVNEEWITDKDRFAHRYVTASDRLTYPQVRDVGPDGSRGELRPASWPEAFAVAARGLAAARDAAGVGVLPGGRLTAEDAFAYATFARLALGTNDVDFRARPLSAEETGFLAAHVVLRGPEGGGVTYSDLERARTVVLAGLEPEEEAGAIFLRLRKAVRAGGTQVVAVAPYLTRGNRKLRAEHVPAGPADEAAALDALAGRLGPEDVLLVGERLATAPGALSAAARLASRTGARLAWVPRRAGDRGALETGCLPNLLPGGRPVVDAEARVDAAAAWGVDALPERPGRDAEQIVSAAAVGRLSGLVVGGVAVDDVADPDALRTALERADFVVSLELRETEVTRAADVVLPVAAAVEKAGLFVTWEGRPRPFPVVLADRRRLPDARVLAGIAEELGRPLGFRTTAQVREAMESMGAWDGERAAGAAGELGTPPATQPLTPESPGLPAGERAGLELRLSTFRQMLDLGSLQDGDEALRASARPAVARLGTTAYEALGRPGVVTLTGPRGALSLPAEHEPTLVDGVVWAPQASVGRGLLSDLAEPGAVVTVSPEAAR